MIRCALLFAAIAMPAGAIECPEYVSMMREEGIRTLVAADCASRETAMTLEGHWNEILAGPYGSCLASRAIAGDQNVLALAVYMTDMNRLRTEQGCPKERNE